MQLHGNCQPSRNIVTTKKLLNGQNMLYSSYQFANGSIFIFTKEWHVIRLFYPFFIYFYLCMVWIVSETGYRRYKQSFLLQHLFFVSSHEVNERESYSLSCYQETRKPSGLKTSPRTGFFRLNKHLLAEKVTWIRVDDYTHLCVRCHYRKY